ncbi:hypothetical protein [Ruminococcus sp.]|uniref:hypothetical protein n=1 Tax=Ruminococcus sp. TaxID=41978 RepID=UPI0025CE5AE9|nr:hypothetical protein [Ruminococcus sp.]MBQ8966265.1 hypothetical protein [Ruminococcus sp.]
MNGLMVGTLFTAGEATTATASESLVNWANSNSAALSEVLNTIAGLAPALLPVAVACLAFRKGIGFIFSVLRGA